MECNKSNLVKNRLLLKAQQVINRGSVLACKIWTMHFKAENKTDKPNRYFTIFLFIWSPYSTSDPILLIKYFPSKRCLWKFASLPKTTRSKDVDGKLFPYQRLPERGLSLVWKQVFEYQLRNFISFQFYEISGGYRYCGNVGRHHKSNNIRCRHSIKRFSSSLTLRANKLEWRWRDVAMTFSISINKTWHSAQRRALFCRLLWGNSLKWEQHSLKCVYWMMPLKNTIHLLYRMERSGERAR